MLMTITEGRVEAKVSAYHYISIPLQVYTDLCAFVDHYDTEVSGCGMVERIEHRFKSEEKDEPDNVEIEFRIKEVFLPDKQDNSAAATDIDEEVIAKLVTDLLAKGKNTEHLRLHWHSHADMDTFHSGTDEDNYATLSNGDFLVSLVINKAHKFLGRVDYFKPVRVTLNNLGVHLDLDLKTEASPVAKESIDKLDKYVKEKRNIQVYNQGEFGYGDRYNGFNTVPLTEHETLEQDLDIAKTLGISKKDAIFFRACKQNTCHCCKHVHRCQEYLYQIDRMSPMY